MLAAKVSKATYNALLSPTIQWWWRLPNKPNSLALNPFLTKT